MYDPRVGRFLEEDPIGFSAGDPDLYGYVGNSPTDETDPTGTKSRRSLDGFSTGAFDHSDLLLVSAVSSLKKTPARKELDNFKPPVPQRPPTHLFEREFDRYQDRLEDIDEQLPRYRRLFDFALEQNKRDKQYEAKLRAVIEAMVRLRQSIVDFQQRNIDAIIMLSGANATGELDQERFRDILRRIERNQDRIDSDLDSLLDTYKRLDMK